MKNVNKHKTAVNCQNKCQENRTPIKFRHESKIVHFKLKYELKENLLTMVVAPDAACDVIFVVEQTAVRKTSISLKISISYKISQNTFS